MTKVYLQQIGNVLELRLEGHADRSSDEDGNLCCAAISMLSAAALEWTAEFMELNKGDELEAVSSPGNVHLKLTSLPEYAHEIKTIYDYLSIGFGLLIDKYEPRVIWGEAE